jgi:predicted anti-sigma-YlaC factor YlaD
MNCQRAEKLLLKSFDRHLEKHEAEILEQHLKSCPECSIMTEEYKTILGALRVSDYPEPKPHFWQRLQPKLREKRLFNPWAQWQQWGLRAIPVALFIVIVLTGVLTVIEVQGPEEMSSSEAFLLQNQNPLQDSSAILEEEKVEDKNMRLIFASLEEPNTPRSKFP